MQKTNRIAELDILRGIAVVFMMADHTMYDLFCVMPLIIKNYPYSILNFSYKYWNWDVRKYGRYVFVAIFLLLVGICCSFSRSNLRRGVTLLAISLGLTFVSFILGVICSDLNYTVVFGILHCIAVTLILAGLFEKLKLSKWFYAVMGFAGVVFGGIVQAKYGLKFTDFGTEPFILLFLKSLIGTRLIGGDCFQIPLYGGIVFIGISLGKLIYPERKPIFSNLPSYGVLPFIGRHSLLFYLAHQAIIPVILTVIFLLSGYGLNI